MKLYIDGNNFLNRLKLVVCWIEACLKLCRLFYDCPFQVSYSLGVRSRECCGERDKTVLEPREGCSLCFTCKFDNGAGRAVELRLGKVCRNWLQIQRVCRGLMVHLSSDVGFSPIYRLRKTRIISSLENTVNVDGTNR